MNSLRARVERGARAWVRVLGIGALVVGGAAAGQDAGAPDPRAPRHKSARDTIVVGLPYPPHTRGLLVAQPDGKRDGFARQVIEAAAREVGLKIEFKDLGNSDDVGPLERGELDAVAPMSVLDGRLGVVGYTAPLVVARGAVFARPGAARVRNMSDLKGSRVVVAQGGVGHQWCLETEVPFEAMPDLKTAFLTIAAGKADYLVTTQAAGRWEIERDGISGLGEYPLDGERFSRSFAIAVRKSDSALLSDLNDGLAILHDTERFDDLYERYMSKYQPRVAGPQMSVRSALWGASAAAVLLAAVAVWQALLKRELSRRTAALQESEKRFEEIACNVPGVVYSVAIGDDGSRRTLAASSGDPKLFEAVGGERVADDPAQDLALVHPEDRVAFQANRERGARFERVDFEWRLRFPDGAYRWVRSIQTPKRVREGMVCYGIMFDVTEQHDARAALQQSEAKYRAIAESLPALVHTYFVADDGRRELRFVNSHSVEWESRFPSLRPGKPYEDTFARDIHPDDRARYDAAVQTARANRSEFDVEFRLRDVNGEYRWAHALVTPLPQPGGVLWQGLLLDVTELRRAEELVRQSERKYRGIFDRCHDAIVVFRPEGEQILDANERACAFYGFPRDEFIGMSLEAVSTSPELGRSRIVETLARPAPIEFRTLHRRRDGSLVEVDISASVIDYNGERAILSLNRDATERVRAERQREEIESKLRETQKLESLGVMAGGIAHDFNNILVGVLGNAGLALNMTETGTDLHKTISTVRQAAQRAADLTRELLAYSGRGRASLEPLSVSAVVAEMAGLLDLSLSRSAVLEKELPEGLPPVLCDPTQLRQVVMNLITNASEALEGRPGRVTLRVSLVELGPEDLVGLYAAAPGCRPGPYLCLHVSDTGAGMSAQTRARIFEPFFTTKFAGRGLGLSAVLGIVRAHGGGIRVESQKGRGSTFRVYLPPAPAGRQTEPTPGEAPAEHASGTEMVLVVDDEALVRDLNAAVLSRAGYRVHTAPDGRGALEAVGRDDGAIDAVILDMTMPGLSGPEVFVEIRRMRPGLPIVLTSGYSGDDAAGELLRTGRALFLQKPYVPEDLLATVRRVLGR